MAGFNPELVTPTLTQAPTVLSSPGSAPATVDPHHGLVGLVLIAALVLFLLDRAGFRFAVTVGKG